MNYVINYIYDGKCQLRWPATTPRSKMAARDVSGTWRHGIVERLDGLRWTDVAAGRPLPYLAGPPGPPMWVGAPTRRDPSGAGAAKVVQACIVMDAAVSPRPQRSAMPQTPKDLVALTGIPNPAGSGRPRGRMRPRGRAVDPTALGQVRDVLGGGRPDRRHLIDYLHAIQDRYGHLAARHLCALAAELNLSQAEVYEVATFYSQFIVVADGAAPPPGVAVRVCDGLACTLKGAARLLEECTQALGDDARVL